MTGLDETRMVLMSPEFGNTGDYVHLCRMYEVVLNDEPRLESIIRYRNDLVRSLDPEPLLNRLGFLLTDGIRADIDRSIQDVGDISGAEHLLGALLECRQPQLYTQLLDALNESDHEKACDLLQGVKKRDDQVFRSVISLRRSEIISHLVVNEPFLNTLIASKCISEKTKEIIQCRREIKGEQAAASILLDKLMILRWDWPELFVEALKSCGLENAAEMLSPDFLNADKSTHDVVEGMTDANAPEQHLESNQTVSIDQAAGQPQAGPSQMPSSQPSPPPYQAMQGLQLTSANPGQSINLHQQSGPVVGTGNFTNFNIGNESQVTINNTVTNNYTVPGQVEEMDMEQGATGGLVVDSNDSRTESTDNIETEIKKLHNKLAIELSKMIRPEYFKDLKQYLIGWKFHGRELDGMVDFLQLWNKLDEKGDIKPQEYSFIENAFQEIEAYYLVAVICTYKEKINNAAGTFINWIKDESLTIKSYKDLMVQQKEYMGLYRLGRLGTLFNNAALRYITPQAGGHLQLKDGSVKIDVPENAVEDPVVLSILADVAETTFLYAADNSPARHIDPDADDVVKYSLPMTFGPAGYQFKIPLKVTFKTHNHPETADGLQVYRKKHDNCVWECIGVCSYDRGTLSATFELSGFSSYVIGMPVSTADLRLNVYVVIQGFQNQDAEVTVHLIVNDYSYIEQFVLQNLFDIDQATGFYLDPRFDLHVIRNI